MAPLLSLALLASAPVGAQANTPSSAPKMAVAASARATVQILPGARVTLGEAPQPDGHRLTAATITVEDGSRRSAKLVEFQ